MSRTLLDLELAELDRQLRQLKPTSVTRLKVTSPAFKQLEIVRQLHKHYREPMPPHVMRLYRNRVNPQPTLLESEGTESC